ncbi:MAG: cyclic nucleotide-binding domain-containing protein, partial [Acidobacteria bacterium]|nr:cyclic nucleotide-binding domain-containing protein [Acidobacteriota bacterium]
MSEMEFLRTVPQLAELDELELNVMEEAMTILDYEPGSIVLEEGTPNRAIHIVRKGRVRVTRKVDQTEVALCDLSEGQTFGELSILGDGVTTATLRAIPKTRIFSLSVSDLDFVLEQSPAAAAKFWQAIARGLSTEGAAAEAGVSSAVGARWFREAGGMPPLTLAPVSRRYLSFAEREEIAILHSQMFGVREIARRISRSPD